MKEAKNLTCWKVAVTLPVKGLFSYAAPDHLSGDIKVGHRVLVPFKERKVTGYVLEKISSEIIDLELKEIFNVVDPNPLFQANMVPFFKWIADYYKHPLGKVIELALPTGLNLNSYKTAVITSSGAKVLAGLCSDSDKFKKLHWIKENRDKKLPFPVKDIYQLQKQGWVIIKNRARKKTTGPLIRKLVKPAPGIDLDYVLSKKAALLRAKNEPDFLKTVLSSQPTLVNDLNFKNARYLVNKWINAGVLKDCSGPVYKDPGGTIVLPEPPPDQLHKHQNLAVKLIQGLLNKRQSSPCLLFGVTGSGKTEVYIRAAEHALQSNRQTIILVPEIALAVYMGSIFRARMGERVVVYHSRLSPGERLYQWRRMVGGAVDVVIGARSALFAPLPAPGLIIVDEEHDPSYKQENAPNYQARDLAVVRAGIQKAVLVLGSGTPSVQSYQNCINGKYRMISMPDRIQERSLPEVHVIDMKKTGNQTSANEMLSFKLREAVAENLQQGNQSILFLNRRGFHRLYLCRACGQSVKCPNCDVALTYHAPAGRLNCHYCGFYSDNLESCPACGRKGLKPYGFGTQKLEHELKKLFPAAGILRIDTDTVRKKNQAARILKSFSEHKTDILVGTQIITKGYHFPEVTLVGIVAADLSLSFPDFRAGERTYQIISQAAGRSGRGVQKGKVIVQTFNPDHYAISAAISHNYELFFEEEMKLRKQLGYPPFSRLACIKLEGNNKDKTTKIVSRLGLNIKKILLGWPRRGKELQVLGPVEAPIAKLKGKYRWQILIKAQSAALLKHFLSETERLSENILKYSGVTLVIDIDPYHMT